MKKILRVRIHGIPPYKDVDESLDKRGLIRLQGPNGAGKSTIFNLMTQMLVGEAPVKREKAHLVPDKKIPYLLEVTWRIFNKTYVGAYAQQSDKLNPNGEAYGTGTYLFEDGVNISYHKATDTVKQIASYFGAPIEEWNATGYVAQAVSHGLINGTPGTRMSYLSKLFGLEKFDRIAAFYAAKAEVLSEKMEDIKKAKNKKEINESLLAQYLSIEELSEKAAAFSASLALYGKNLDLLRVQHTKYLQRVELQNTLNTVPEEIKNFQIVENLFDLTAKEKELSSHQVNLAMKEDLVRREAALPVIAKQELPDKHEFFLGTPDINEAEVTHKKNLLTAMKNSLVEVQPVVVPADLQEVLFSPDIHLQQYKDLVAFIKARPQAPTVPNPTSQDMQNLQFQNMGLVTSKGELETTLRQLSFGKSKCDTCGTDLNCTDREQEKLNTQNKLNSVLADMTKLGQEVAQSYANQKVWNDYLALGPDRSGELPILEIAIANFEKKQAYVQINAQKIKYDEYLVKAESIKEIPALELSLYNYQMKKYVQQIQKWNQDYDANEKVRTELKTQMDSFGMSTQDMREKIKALESDITNYKKGFEAHAAYTSLKQKVEELISYVDCSLEIKKVEEESATASQELGFIQSQSKMVQGILDEMVKITAEIASSEQVQRDYSRFTALTKAYGKSGVLRKLQLSRFNTFLSNALMPYTNRLLPQIKFSFNIEEGVEFLAEKGGVEYDVKTCSGGEKGCLSLALVFALDDISPSHKKFNLKIIDEIEAFMDKERKEDFLHFIVPELRKRAETIILISHTAAAKDIEYDGVLEMRDGELISVGENREFIT